ncbi:hypothetical protein [Burkholderia sp. MSMB1459WGS]|uniref:hypothetical protein n=1 Tax=Burkholderia sp. MSMB1459WGS TaxID=1637970 RepID=UPI0012E35D0A|nr:hypothetical protein [Burkholderia sp. MSMB1459WGS]
MSTSSFEGDADNSIGAINWAYIYRGSPNFRSGLNWRVLVIPGHPGKLGVHIRYANREQIFHIVIPNAGAGLASEVKDLRCGEQSPCDIHRWTSV